MKIILKTEQFSEYEIEKKYLRSKNELKERTSGNDWLPARFFDGAGQRTRAQFWAGGSSGGRSKGRGGAAMAIVTMVATLAKESDKLTSTSNSANEQLKNNNNLSSTTKLHFPNC